MTKIYQHVFSTQQAIVGRGGALLDQAAAHLHLTVEKRFMTKKHQSVPEG